MVKLKRILEGKVARNQKGYIGQSMSVRARLAYDNGEMPKSKWTKDAMLEALSEEFGSDASKDFSKYSKDVIFRNCFSKSSWHHTGAFANATDFYSLNIQKTLDFSKKNNIESMKNVIDDYSEKEKRDIEKKAELEKQEEIREIKRLEIIKKEIQNTVEKPRKEGMHYTLTFTFRGKKYDYEYTDLKDAEKYYKTAKTGIEEDWLDANFWESISDRLPYIPIS